MHMNSFRSSMTDKTAQKLDKDGKKEPTPKLVFKRDSTTAPSKESSAWYDYVQNADGGKKLNVVFVWVIPFKKNAPHLPHLPIHKI